jgi:hypothetical protein
MQTDGRTGMTKAILRNNLKIQKKNLNPRSRRAIPLNYVILHTFIFLSTGIPRYTRSHFTRSRDTAS